MISTLLPKPALNYSHILSCLHLPLGKKTSPKFSSEKASLTRCLTQSKHTIKFVYLNWNGSQSFFEKLMVQLLHLHHTSTLTICSILTNICYVCLGNLLCNYSTMVSFAQNQYDQCLKHCNSSTSFFLN